MCHVFATVSWDLASMLRKSSGCVWTFFFLINFTNRKIKKVYENAINLGPVLVLGVTHVKHK